MADLRKFKRVDRIRPGVMGAQNPDTLSRLSPLRDRTLEEEKIESSVVDFVVTGEFQHSGDTAGWYGALPVGPQGPFVQTYATASMTHAAPTAAALTDSSTGTSDGTVSDVGGAFNQATLNNNNAEFCDRINKLVADLENVKQVLNAVINADQLQGFKT